MYSYSARVLFTVALFQPLRQMTGPTSRTDGSEKSFTVGNRLKQHYIYRLISAKCSRPFPPSDWDLGFSRKKISVIYVNLEKLSFGIRHWLLRRRKGNKGRLRWGIYNFLYIFGSLLHIFNQFMYKWSDPGINELFTLSFSTYKVK